MVCWLFAAGCSASGGYLGSNQAADAAAGQEPGAAPGAFCPVINLTQPCFCQNGGELLSGRQTCSAKGWDSCECIKSSDPVIDSGIQTRNAVDVINKGSAQFNWQTTRPPGLSCEAGYYTGFLNGLHISAAEISGGPVVCVVGFKLVKAATEEAYEIDDGYMQGTTFFYQSFSATISGYLDCTEEPAVLNGYIKDGSYIVRDVAYPFKGEAKANYDKFNHALTGGLWAMTEPDENGNWPDAPDFTPGPGQTAPQLPLDQYGASGDWSANLVQ